MSDALLVGMDVGTTSCKVTVCTVDGREAATGKAPLSWEVTRDGVETDPANVLQAVGAATVQALAQVPQGPVVGVGVASMGEAGVLLDRRGEPIAPVIAWHDDRDRRLTEQLSDDLGPAEFIRSTGLPVRPQWSLTKHRWLTQHFPDAQQAVRRLGIAEWVVRALGGEEASEFSLASRTGWLRIDSAQWWPASLEWSGAKPSLLPPLVAAGTLLGRANASWAGPRLLGAHLTVAGHDHLAAAIGADAAGDGDQLDSCGTAEALVRTVPAPLGGDAVQRLVAADVTVGRHALAGRLSLLGDTRGGLLLQNVQRLLGFDSAQLPDLDAAALKHRDPGVTASLEADGTVALHGIGRNATPDRAWYAALAAGMERAARMDTDMAAVLGPHRRTVMTGGWSRSLGVRQLRGEAWHDVTVSPVHEAGGRGAALLGGVAAGIYPSPDDLPTAATGGQPDRATQSPPLTAGSSQ
ncbi:L-fuculokinase [Streptomyces sp. NPDC002680]|uniref:FGGY-family carbohydrate kinase n=1 Tax=Streptomyces sp. NPDC002680 TaxID=3364659 RepID=UPI0036C01753